MAWGSLARKTVGEEISDSRRAFLNNPLRKKGERDGGCFSAPRPAGQWLWRADCGIPIQDLPGARGCRREYLEQEDKERLATEPGRRSLDGGGNISPPPAQCAAHDARSENKDHYEFFPESRETYGDRNQP